MNMNLFIGARQVRAIEKETGKKILQIITDQEFLSSMEVIHLFFKYGLGMNTTDEQADDAIDNFLRDGDHSYEDLILEVMKGMQEAGFFKKSLNLEEVKEKALEQVEAQAIQG